MPEIFVLWSLPFWLLVVAVTIALMACVEFRRSILPGVLIVGMIIALQVWGGGQILSFVKNHPRYVAIGFAAYIVLGVIWGVGKWDRYVKHEGRKALEALEAFRKSFDKPGYKSPSMEYDREHPNRLDTRPRAEIFEADWKHHLSHGHFGGVGEDYSFEFEPDWRRHKEDITMWMTYWPWSFAWTILHDPFKAIVRNLSGLLKYRSERAFRQVKGQYQEALAKASGATSLDGGKGVAEKK